MFKFGEGFAVALPLSLAIGCGSSGDGGLFTDVSGREAASLRASSSSLLVSMAASIDVPWRAVKHGKVRVPLPGTHNRLN
jgi:hypothetical protein